MGVENCAKIPTEQTIVLIPPVLVRPTTQPVVQPKAANGAHIPAGAAVIATVFREVAQ